MKSAEFHTKINFELLLSCNITRDTYSKLTIWLLGTVRVKKAKTKMKLFRFPR